MTSRPSTAAPILAVLAIVLVTLGAYGGGYFWLGTFVDWRNGGPGALGLGIERIYDQHWQPEFFRPAAWVEARLRGCEVQMTYDPHPVFR